MKTIAGPVLTLLILSIVAACSSGEDHTPLPTPSPGRADGYESCRVEAARAEAAIEEGGSIASDESRRLAALVATLGSPYDVPTSGYSGVFGFLWGNWDEVYEEATGSSAWRNAEAHEAYVSTQRDCLERNNLSSVADPFMDWTSGQQTATRCIIAAVLATEDTFGIGRVAYRSAYLQYVESRTTSDAEPDYLFSEVAYKELTGVSPFVDDAAAQAFRDLARGCVN